MNEQEQTDQAAETTRNNNPIEICYQTNRDTAEYCLRILNWFFDQNPDHYLVQRPRVVYDSDGNEKKSVRYQIRKKGDQKDESGKTAAADQGDPGRTGTSETGDQSPDKHIQEGISK